VRPRVIIVALLLLAGLAAAGYFGYRYYWVHRYDDLIARVAPVYELEPELVHAVIYEESFFWTHARSGAGAKGLMQVTEVVLSEWRAEKGYEKVPPPARQRASARGAGSEAVLADPELNLHIGCWYLRKMLARFRAEDDPLAVALAAYNAGATNAERWLRARRPTDGSRDARARAFVEAIDYPETREYVEDVTRRYRTHGPGSRSRTAR
jgi:soluble lytic murein transglycosylase